MKKLAGPIIGFHFIKKKSVINDKTEGLTQFPHLKVPVKIVSSEIGSKLKLFSLIMPWQYHQKQWKKYSFCRQSVGMEYNRSCDTIAQVYENSKSADFLLNVKKILQESGSQSNQYSRITTFTQKGYAKCRILRSCSGAIQF